MIRPSGNDKGATVPIGEILFDVILMGVHTAAVAVDDSSLW